MKKIYYEIFLTDKYIFFITITEKTRVSIMFNVILTLVFSACESDSYAKNIVIFQSLITEKVNTDKNCLPSIVC